MLLSESGEAFQGPRGEILIFDGEFGPYFYSEDGKSFYKLELIGGMSEDKNCDATIGDPLAYRDLNITRGRFAHTFKPGSNTDIDYNIVRVNGKVFRKIPVEPGYEFQVSPIPSGEREVVGLFQLPDWQFIYVSDEKNSKSYSTLSLYLEHNLSKNFLLDKIIIWESVRYKNGKLYLRTDAGELTVTPPGKDPAILLWNDVPLVRLDPDEYSIQEEQNDKVRITRKG